MSYKTRHSSSTLLYHNQSRANSNQVRFDLNLSLNSRLTQIKKKNQFKIDLKLKLWGSNLVYLIQRWIFFLVMNNLI